MEVDNQPLLVPKEPITLPGKTHPSAVGVDEDGVLSIPPEEKPGCCKSKVRTANSFRMLLVPVLSALLSSVLLSVLQTV